MKSVRLSLVLALAILTSLTPAFAADPPVSGDQQKLLQHLERTREKFLNAVSGLSEAQWNFKASPEKWSIAQCAEHITAAESLLRGMIVKSLETPTPEDVLKQGVAKDDMILSLVVDRSRKFNAPEPLVPTARYGSPAETLETFRKERAETLKLAESGDALRKHAAAHPALGQLDAYGWVLFLSAHTERHTLQIEEVKASEGFPAE